MMEGKRTQRICLYTRAWRASGAGLFAQELVAGMVGAGARVTFVAPPTETPALENARDGLVRIRPPRERGPQASRPVRMLVSLARILGGALSLARARLSNRVFVVTIPDPLVFSVPMLALLRLTGARIIFVAHDPVPHAWRLPARWRRLERAVHGACYHLASVVVVLSEPSRAKLRETFPGVGAPVEVIEHGVFPLPTHSELPGDGVLLAFGTIRRNKGFMEAIEGVIAARERGVSVRLIVAGAAHREDRDYCRLCVERARSAPDAVELRIGYVADDALPPLFARVDALVMPYGEFFSQSGVALLAASNGRPVIAAAAGGIAALIAEGMPAEIIAEPVSAETVGAAVRRFRETDAATWRHRAEAYRQVTLDRRSWARIGADYCRLADRLGG